MKKIVLLATFIFLLSSCATQHMVVSERHPKIITKPNMATLVIIRDAWFGSAIVFWNYLDGKMIGETKGKTYFVTYVKPGPHYVVIATENTAVAHFNFRPGKKYYLREGITVGMWRARTTGFYPMSPEEAGEAIKACTYLEYDPKTGGEDMDPKLYQQAIDEYHADVKQNPQAYKVVLEYKGY
jgi:hypothetical protein